MLSRYNLKHRRGIVLVVTLFFMMILALPFGYLHDRLGNVEQLAALRAAGWSGPVSFEAFAPEIHALADPAAAVTTSMNFIGSELAAKAA